MRSVRRSRHLVRRSILVLMMGGQRAAFAGSALALAAGFAAGFAVTLAADLLAADLAVLAAGLAATLPARAAAVVDRAGRAFAALARRTAVLPDFFTG